MPAVPETAEIGRLLLEMLKPAGWLGIMTRLVTDEVDFTQWYYKNDPTHVSFFSRETFRYLAERDKLKVEFIGDNVILLRATTIRAMNHTATLHKII